MQLHANAALSLIKRRQMVRRVVDDGWTVKAAAEAAGTSSRTCGKWVARYRADGETGLLDRSSAPAESPTRTPKDRVEAIAVLRRLRMTGPEIAEVLSMPLSTVSGVLARIGMGKLGRLGQEPPARYERARPGELIHMDVKKLGRIPAARDTASPATSTTTAATSTPVACVVAASAGNTSTSRSMTPRAWHTPKCSPTRKHPRRSGSCAVRLRSSSATA
jgi:transposase-like protein